MALTWIRRLWHNNGTSKKKSRRRPEHQHRARLALEALEDRRLLCTIVWANENDPNNGFANLGANEATAKLDVSDAISTWENAIQNFNRPGGGNSYSVNISMSDPGGYGGNTSITAFDAGYPTAANITIATGGDGHGSGYFFDPTPSDNSEFEGTIVNDFSGMAQSGSPANGLVDFQTVVLHELCHAMGLCGSNSLYATSSYNHETPFPNPPAYFWVFQGPSVTHVMTSNNAGTSDAGVPIHSAWTDANFTWEGQNYVGVQDLMNAGIGPSERRLIPSYILLILHDVYNYDVTAPQGVETMYSMLDSQGNLLVRDAGGNDTITLSMAGPDVQVHVALGTPVPGISPNPVYVQDYAASSISNITVSLGSGNDNIHFDSDVPANVQSLTFVNSPTPGTAALTIYDVSAGAIYTIGVLPYTGYADPRAINCTSWNNPVGYLPNFTSVTLNTGPATNIVQIGTAWAATPITINGDGPSQVLIGYLNAPSSGVRGILGNVTIHNLPGDTTLIVDDTGDLYAQTATLGKVIGTPISYYIDGIEPGSIQYDSSAVSSVSLYTDAVSGNKINVLETGVQTDLYVDAPTSVTIGDSTAGAWNIVGNIYMQNVEDSSADKGDLAVTIDDSASSAYRTATATAFTPGSDSPFLSPYTICDQISGLSQGTINYEEADTGSVDILGGANDLGLNDNRRIRIGETPINYAAQPAIAYVTPVSGYAGESITICGVDIDMNSVVYFGNNATTVESVRIFSAMDYAQVMVPSGTSGATVDVRVSNLGDKSPITSADQFTYVTPPTVSSISPVDGPLAGGTVVTISGTLLNTVNEVDFGNTPAAKFRINTNGTITATAPPGSSGKVDVVVTAADGVPSPDTTADLYDYLAAPVVTSVSPQAGPLSNGSTVVITGTDLGALNNQGALEFNPTVYFGQVQATLTGWVAPSQGSNVWQLDVTPPAEAAATVDVTVKTPGDTSAISTSDKYTYTVAPVINTIYPQVSSMAGGLVVSIIGSGLDKVTEVDFGTTKGTNITISGSSQLWVTSPSGAAGTVDVRVKSPGGTSPIVTNDEYTYLAPPTITSVSPQFGPYEGGTVVTIQGTNLSSVAPVVRFGGFYGTPGTILSDTGTQIMVTSPAHAAGLVDIQVFTTGGGSTISTADEFNYIHMTPIINSISPSSGPTGGGTTVTISGNYFLGTTMVYFGDTHPASFITVNSDTQITATSPPESAGAPVDVRVVAWGLESATTPQDHFTYEAPPVVSSISPSSGTVAGGTTVIITGSNLSGATEVDFGSVAGTIVSGTNTAGQITVTSPPGTVGTSPDVTVVTTVGRSTTSSADKFSYYIPVPVVTGLSPIVGDTGVRPTVTISGSNLSNASWVKFGTIAATIDSDTNNQIVVTGPAIGTAGMVDVTVNTAGGTSAIVPADQFTYGDVPNISALVRPTGGPGNIGPADYSGWQIDIDGANLAGATEVDFGASKVTSFLVDTATEIVVAVPNEDPGTVSLTVKTSFGTSAAAPYTYVPGPVIIDAYTANNTMDGPLTGGTSITIRGIHMSDATAVNFGSTAVTNFTYTDYGGGYGAITVTSPPSAAGPVYISVTSPEGTSTNKPVLFDYLPVPTVSGISPASGPTVGGSTVAISGADLSFTTGVFFGGIAATSFSYSYSGGEILAVAPAGSGTVDVTVTTDGGTSATSSADQFTYVYVPPPVVLGLSPTSSGLSGGVSVTIAGTDLGYATAVDFGGATASFTVNPDGTISAVAPMEISDCTVNVTVTTLVGTSATSAADQFSYVGPPVVASLDTNIGSVYGSTRVTISGTDLASATAVRFGSNPATIVGETDDQGVDSLVVLSPEATGDTPGPVDITVNTPYGTTTDSSAFNYYLPPIVTAISTSVGPTAGGTALTISGTNLWSVTAVSFGSIAATSFTYNYSDGTISAVSPTGSVSTVDVTVVNPGGTSPVSSADQFTYLPAPSVSGISPAAGTLSGGSSVLISGTGLTIATEVDFGGFGPASFTVNPDGTISAVAPPNGSGTKCAVDVTVTTAGGTSATSSADLFTYAAPPSVMGISPTWGNAAGGDIVTITGTNLDGATVVDFGTSAGRIIYDSDSQIQVVSPAGAIGTIGVTVVAPGGTSVAYVWDDFNYIGAPVAATDNYSVTQGTTLSAYGTGVLANDTDPQSDPLTAELLANPSHGTFSFYSDGSFVYTPNSGYVGVDAFVYQANNGYLTSDPTIVSVTVNPATLTWDGVSSGNWTDSQWTPTSSTLYYPDSGVNAIVNTPSVVQVNSTQAANALTLSGSGQVDVTAGSNLTITTNTSVSGGATLQVDSNNGTFNAGGNVTLDTGGNITGGSVTAATYQLNDGTVSASLSGSDLTKSGTGTVTLSGTNTYTGATTINGGTLELASTGQISTSSVISTSSSATFQVDGTHTVGTISGTGTTVVSSSGSLTVTSITQGTLTIGAGAVLTIAPLPGGPQAAGDIEEIQATSFTTSANSQTVPSTSATQEAAIDSVSKVSSTTTEAVTASSLANIAVLAAPTTALVETTTATPNAVPITKPIEAVDVTPISTSGNSSAACVSADTVTNAIVETTAGPLTDVAAAQTALVITDFIQSRQIDVAIKHDLSQSPIYSRTDLIALPRTIENSWYNSLSGSVMWIIEAKTMDCAPFHDELPVHTALIQKLSYSPATINPLAHRAALQTIIQNPNWKDAEADFDITPLTQLGKHFGQLYKAVDAILSEKEDVFLTVQ
ncbi:MAG: IPT/TIG domain-containing protein [Thermoguttaceae bacterium]|jgi:autotransporter-associated beta strand protein